MTGHGRGECAQEGYKVTVEASSVNRKQTEVSVNLPRALEPLEAQVRDEVNRCVARGKLVVRVALHAGEVRKEARMLLNADLARAYAAEFASLAGELKLEGGCSLDTLLRAPGVLQTVEEVADAEDYWPAVKKALALAMEALVRMREREGDHLGNDLKARIGTIAEAAARIRERAPQVQVRYREQLLERVKATGVELGVADEDRLLKEVVLFADRSDITEELTRLQSHFQQFEDCVRAQEPVGRTLDFLSQEMGREINTIGSKANDALISREVVTVKAELERFREQVQNVE